MLFVFFRQLSFFFLAAKETKKEIWLNKDTDNEKVPAIHCSWKVKTDTVTKKNAPAILRFIVLVFVCIRLCVRARTCAHLVSAGKKCCL